MSLTLPTATDRRGHSGMRKQKIWLSSANNTRAPVEVSRLPRQIEFSALGENIQPTPRSGRLACGYGDGGIVVGPRGIVICMCW